MAFLKQHAKRGKDKLIWAGSKNDTSNHIYTSATYPKGRPHEYYLRMSDADGIRYSVILSREEATEIAKHFGAYVQHKEEA